MIGAVSCPYFRRALGWCVPIGGLGGLIGLGGGEFRLPVLMYGIGFDARSAVPLNLLTSLITLAFALAVRSRAVSLASVVPHLPEMIGLLAGGTASAFYGAHLVSRLRQPPRPTDRRVARLTRPVDDRGSVPAVSIGRPVAGERDGAFYRGRRHRDRRRAGQ